MNFWFLKGEPETGGYGANLQVPSYGSNPGVDNLQVPGYGANLGVANIAGNP